MGKAPPILAASSPPSQPRAWESLFALTEFPLSAEFFSCWPNHRQSIARWSRAGRLRTRVPLPRPMPSRSFPSPALGERRHRRARRSRPHSLRRTGEKPTARLRIRSGVTGASRLTQTSFFSWDVLLTGQLAMASELSIFVPLRQALLYCFQFYE